MNKVELENLILEFRSSYKIAKHLGKSNSTILYWVERLDIKEFYKKNSTRTDRVKNNIYNKEELEAIIKNCYSYKDVFRKLNKCGTGGNNKILKKYLKEFNIDTSHFNPKRYLEEGRGTKKTNDEFFIKGSFKGGTTLKKKLRGLIEFKCKVCGLGEVWNGIPIVLQIDHLDGDNTNNELKNLRLLCPNCHSQTDTFCGKHRKSKDILCDCGAKKSKVSKMCRKCLGRFRPTKIMFDIEVLRKEVWGHPMTELCKRYNMSDVGLAKVCKRNNIERPKRGYFN